MRLYAEHFRLTNKSSSNDAIFGCEYIRFTWNQNGTAQNMWNHVMNLNKLTRKFHNFWNVYYWIKAFIIQSVLIELKYLLLHTARCTLMSSFGRLNSTLVIHKNNICPGKSCIMISDHNPMVQSFRLPLQVHPRWSCPFWSITIENGFPWSGIASSERTQIIPKTQRLTSNPSKQCMFKRV